MTWQNILGLFTGLALFIYGMHLMTSSLKSLSLSKIKKWIDKATSNRFKAFLVGTGITAVIQSSSATSVIAVGFLNVGILSLTRAIPIVFGANIGTTVTAQLIAFKLTAIAPLFVIGGLAVYFTTKKLKKKSLGMAIFGFGLLFFGLAMMSSSVKPFAQEQAVLDIFVNFGKYPVLGILAGLIITMLLQSSSTTIGIVIALATAGLLDFHSAFFLVLGDNIGTCITAVIASLGGNKSGKRLALAHVMFNFIGSIIAFILAPIYFKVIPLLSSDLTRQIANSHTIFNAFNAIIFLPFVPVFVKTLNKIIKGKDYKKKLTKYLDRTLLSSPSLAFKSAVSEMHVMTKACQEIMKKSQICINQFNYKIYEEVIVDEDSIDEMQVNITGYISEVSTKAISEAYSKSIPSLLHSINDLERISDHCENISKIARKKHEEKVVFPKEAHEELNTLFSHLDKLFSISLKAMKENHSSVPVESALIESEINSLTEKYKFSSVSRLNNGDHSLSSKLIFIDLLTHIEKVGDHLFNITTALSKNKKIKTL